METLDSMFQGLFEEPATESADGSSNDEIFSVFDEGADELTPAAESAIFLETLMDTFDNPSEFADYAMENATFWEVYGLIDDAQAALESVKRFQVNDWKRVNFERLWKREALRIEARLDSNLWKKYHLYRTKMREEREKIFKKNENKAKRNVRQAQSNSKRKVAAMGTSSSKDLQSRLNKSISKSSSGENPTNGKPS